jgi:hypothetical protein
MTSILKARRAGIFVDWYFENGQSSVRSDIIRKLTEYAAPKEGVREFGLIHFLGGR